MFSKGDPFADVDNLMPKQENADDGLPATQPIALAPADQTFRFTSQVPEPSSATVDRFTRFSPAPGRNGARRASGSGSLQRTEGYYVAFRAILPGVYSSP